MKKIAIDLAFAALLVFAPIKATLITVMVLCTVDLVSGIWASIHKKKKITSSGLKRTVVKVLAYESVVMLGFLTETYLTGPDMPVTKILGGYIGIVELKSVMENIELISGVPVLRMIINKLTKSVKEMSE